MFSAIGYPRAPFLFFWDLFVNRSAWFRLAAVLFPMALWVSRSACALKDSWRVGDSENTHEITPSGTQPLVLLYPGHFSLRLRTRGPSNFLIESGAYPAYYNAGQNMHAMVIPSLFLLLISTSLCFMFLHACLLCFSRTPVSDLMSARYCFMECLCQGWPHQDDKIYQLGWLVFIEPFTRNFHEQSQEIKGHEWTANRVTACMSD